MEIEEEIFNNYLVNKDKLEEYGFKKVKEKYKFTKNILDNNFEIIVEYEEKIKGKIIELNFREEFSNFRRENIGAFNKKVKAEFIKLLIDIREKCCEKDSFIFPQTKRINKFIYAKYKISPEFLWINLPNYAVYRKNKKWFGIVALVERNKIDKASFLTDKVEIINVKVNPLKINKLVKRKGIYEAFHMNKKNWISILLDNTLTDLEIQKLIKDSYDLLK